MLGLEQQTVADRAGISVATLRRAETAHVVEGTFRTITAVLERAGVEFIPDGVRRRQGRTAEEIAERMRIIEELTTSTAAAQAKQRHPWTEDTLYDENGLPR